MTDYTEPPIKTGPETFVNTGQVIADLKSEVARLEGQLATVTKELAEAKELMRELKNTLTEEYDGTFTLLDRVKAGMLHANYLARKALNFEGEHNNKFDSV